MKFYLFIYLFFNVKNITDAEAVVVAKPSKLVYTCRLYVLLMLLPVPQLKNYFYLQDQITR